MLATATAATLAGRRSWIALCHGVGTLVWCGINPQHYLRYVLELIADHPISRIDELLPWAVAGQIAPDAQKAQDLALAA